MTPHARADGGDPLRLLAAYRFPIYLGGLLAIGALPALARAGVAVPVTVRTAVVVVSLAVMVATYVGERRARVVGSDGDPKSGTAYPLRARAAVAAAVFGIALGVYVALEVNPIVGLLFVAGAYLFGRVGYRGVGS